ncbi:hypothetical protein PCS_03102 [Desulfocurvibacter africanus PCS]|uniref:Uncharacterized protein n=1 Tax=Desulfocurvibacter africanus PCS TaxID=1262666 RepID=M5PQ88_DESAF|nr:hypothetical protein [Desulfocurvibacter africanus]EMG36160.1 hypothetical protein PCS_03102 [Desulfocurvibacter africanus PCS]
MYKKTSRSTRQSASTVNYRDIYVFICDHYRKNGKVPTLCEISMRLGVQKTYLVRFNAFVKAMGVEVASLAAGRVHIPWPVESLHDVLEASDLYACQTGQRPSYTQLAEALNMEEEQLRQITPRKAFFAHSKSLAERRKALRSRRSRFLGLEGMVVQESERLMVYFRDGHLLRKQALPLNATSSLDGLRLEPVRRPLGNDPERPSSLSHTA